MEFYGMPKIASPFDESARQRQMHMGLLDAEGGVDQDAVAVIARVYAGLLYDDLCESPYNEERLPEICDRLTELQETGDMQQMLILICLQYDSLLRALPEAIWWIVGSPALIEPFITAFSQRLCEFVEQGR